MTYTGPERRSSDRAAPVLISEAATGRAVIQAVAEQHGLSAEALIGRSQAKEITKARGKAALAVRKRFPTKSLAEIGRLFNRNKNTIDYILKLAEKNEKIVRGNLGQEDYILEVEAQMRRICGINLSHQVQYALGINAAPAILLSILMDAYPRVMTYDQVLEAYEAAVERLYQKEMEQKRDGLIRTLNHTLRRSFSEMGLPNPVDVVTPRALVLSHDAAAWLHSRFGRPAAVSSHIRLIA